MEVEEDAFACAAPRVVGGAHDAIQFAIAARDAVTPASPDAKAARYEFVVAGIPGKEPAARCCLLAKPGDALTIARERRGLAGLGLEKAKAAGADEVGTEELVKKIQGGWFEFDVAVAVPAMMRHVGKLGRVLGPKGLMPSPKAGTVTDKVGEAVKEFKAGRVEFRCDSGGNVHVGVGKISFAVDDLVENIEAFLDTVRRAKPAAVKGNYIQKAILGLTMSPGVRLAGVA